MFVANFHGHIRTQCSHGVEESHKKEKKIVANEEKQLCQSMIRVLQDPIIGNGEKNQAFWKRITTHYNNNYPLCCVECIARSLETKWGVIKHNVAKFCGNCQVVATLNKSGESFKDALQKTLQLFKTKHQKQSSFVFIHYSSWFLKMFLGG